MQENELMESPAEHEGLAVWCPYCGEEFHTSRPRTLKRAPASPHEVVCVPYTRDVGRYDPAGPEHWFDPEGWSRIGTDFLPFWERIGILRVTKKNVDVRYRVQACPHCGNLFDVYANYNPEGEPLGDLWPHLFGLDSRSDSRGIREYSGESWPIRLVRDFGRLLQSNLLGALLIGLLMFAAGVWPWLVRPGVPFTESFEATRDLYLIVYGIAALGCSFLLFVSERFIQFLEATTEFRELFCVHADHLYGLTHWRNFTLCRFVGVQPGAGLPRPTQVDVIAGGLAQAMALIWWAGLKQAWLAMLFGAAGLLLGSTLFLGLHRLRRAASIRGVPAGWRAVFYLSGTFLSALWLDSLWRSLPAGWQSALWRVLQINFDLLFWLLLAYLFGTAAWLALNSTAYVLQGATRIPMRLDPWEDFARVRPLRVLQRYSTGIMLLLFATALTLVSAFAVAQNLSAVGSLVLELDWMLAWLRWSLALLFTAVAVGLGEMNFVGITLIYLALAFGLSGTQFEGGEFILDGRVVSLGVFFTLLLVYHLTFTDRLIDRLLVKARDNVISQINGLIRAYRLSLDELAMPLENTREESGIYVSVESELGPIEVKSRPGWMAGVWSFLRSQWVSMLGGGEMVAAARDVRRERQRHHALAAIQKLLQIRARIANTTVSASTWPRFAQAVSPFLGSVLLPLGLETFVQQFLP